VLRSASEPTAAPSAAGVSAGSSAGAASLAAPAGRPAQEGDDAGGPEGLEGPDGPEGPCLDRLGELVQESQAAGMGVELTVEGEARPCGARVEATVYRVVQEALTNVHKHAAGAKAHIRLAFRDAEIAVLVTNSPPDGSAPTPLPSGGHGLTGMRERVTSHGGGFAAGPTPEGGFRVSALLPLA
jgi:signal transduction histidine kinase